MKLSDYIARFIAKHSKHAFVGNGGCIVHVLDSLSQIEEFKLIPCQNEQGASIAAESYSRVSDGVGVAIATSGPGIINLFQGIACAYYDSIPCIFLTGNVPVSHLKGEEKVRQLGFQEMDVVRMLTPITKYCVTITDPLKIRYELEKMLYMAVSGRKGPVVLDLPDDLQRAEINPSNLERFLPPIEEISYEDIDKGLNQTIELITNSVRPLVIVGAGVKFGKAEPQMLEFLQKTGIPYVGTWATLDMFTESSENYVGNFGVSGNRPGNYAIQTADLIISFGSRLDTHEVGNDPNTFAPYAKKISIDIDKHELKKEKGVCLDVMINCDVKTLLDKLIQSEIFVNNLTKWTSKVKVWLKKYPVCHPEWHNQQEYVNPYVFMDALAKLTKKGAIIITDAGATLNWTMQGYRMKEKQKLYSAFNHSPMGYALPASLGAQFACRDKQVVCISGDGGMVMNIQELETVFYHKLPIKIFIMNNREYGIIKQTQDTWLESRYAASDSSSGLGSPDFIEIAKAYKIKAIEIENHAHLNEKIQEALLFDGPLLCNVKIKSGEQIIPKLVFGKTLENLAPFVSQDTLKKDLDFSC
jgi:acetolactate synthase I/II/III large subunit